MHKLTINRIHALLDYIYEYYLEDNSENQIMGTLEALDDLFQDCPDIVLRYYQELKDWIAIGNGDCSELEDILDLLKTSLRSCSRAFCYSIDNMYENEFSRDDKIFLDSLRVGEVIDILEDMDDHIVQDESANTLFEEDNIKINQALSYLLPKYFPNGIKVYDDVQVAMLREQARADFDGYAFNLSTKAIVARIQSMSTLVDKGVWKYGKIVVSMPSQIKSNMHAYLQNYKYDIIPIQAVFEEFEDELHDVGIDNKYALHGQLRNWELQYGIDRDYIYRGHNTSIYTLIEEYVLQTPSLVTKDMIRRELPGISDVAILQASSETRIVNMYDYYGHLDKMDLSTEDINSWLNFMQSKIQGSNIYNSKDLYIQALPSLNGIFSRIGVSHYLQFFSLSEKLFKEKFSFVRPYIALKGVVVKNGEKQLIDKLEQYDVIAISEIGQIAKTIGTHIDRYIDFVNGLKDFVFLNRREIIKSSELGLRKSSFYDLDTVLDGFMEGDDYKALDLFANYKQLPELNRLWNEWTLYSVIRKFSKKYSITTSSNVLQYARPYVVKKGFDISDIEYDTAGYSSRDVEFIDIDDEDILDYIDLDDFD